MTLHYEGQGVQLWHGDCIDILATLPDNSVDAVCTDPPYGLEFMGKDWDSFGPQRDARTAGRVGEGAQTNGVGFGDGTFKDFKVPAFGSSKPSTWRCDRCNKRDQFRAHSPSVPDCDGRWIKEPIYEGAPRQLLAFQKWCEQWAAQCLRVLKPGGHLLAFGGSRTHHRLTSGIEDAGFEIRDTITWHFASGFPKSLDVSKSIDRAAGAEREVVGAHPYAARGGIGGTLSRDGHAEHGYRPDGAAYPSEVGRGDLTAPATDAARQWQGWGTALKPATEYVICARKPLAGTVAANVQAWGTGALNIDAARIGTDEDTSRPNGASYAWRNSQPRESTGAGVGGGSPAGRWPANVIFDETQAAHLDEQSGERPSGANPTRRGVDGDRSAYGDFNGQEDANPARGADTGGASRFFFVAKADASERPSYRRLDCECEGPQPETIPQTRKLGDTCPVCGAGTKRVSHPTVKPLDLMRQLARLVTPPGGTVLEPFPGSGTTVEACLLEGFRCIAIEKGGEYVPLILARIHRQRDPVQAIKLAGEPLGLFDFGTEETT